LSKAVSGEGEKTKARKLAEKVLLHLKIQPPKGLRLKCKYYYEYAHC